MSKDYRRIWESKFGKIPKDEQGRPYEIHHIDGDRSNNAIENLACVSIEEHYNIHLKQDDFAACLLIATRMDKEYAEICGLAKERAILRRESMMGERNHAYGKSFVKDAGLKWFTNGTINLFVNPKAVPEGYYPGRVIHEDAKKQDLRGSKNPNSKKYIVFLDGDKFHISCLREFSFKSGIHYSTLRNIVRKCKADEFYSRRDEPRYSELRIIHDLT